MPKYQWIVLILKHNEVVYTALFLIDTLGSPCSNCWSITMSWDGGIGGTPSLVLMPYRVRWVISFEWGGAKELYFSESLFSWLHFHFEPKKYHLKVLLKNIQLNIFKNVEVFLTPQNPQNRPFKNGCHCLFPNNQGSKIISLLFNFVKRFCHFSFTWCNNSHPKITPFHSRNKSCL